MLVVDVIVVPLLGAEPVGCFGEALELAMEGNVSLTFNDSPAMAWHTCGEHGARPRSQLPPSW